MDYLLRDLEAYIESGSFSNSPYYINRFSKEDYITLFEIIKDWVFDGLDQHLPNKDMDHQTHLLISSSLIYCSWIITHVLKKGVNDHAYNSKKLKYIFSKTDLEKKVDLNLIEEFLISGIGMAISQCSEVLSITNNDVCRMVVSLNLIMAEQLISHSTEYHVA